MSQSIRIFVSYSHKDSDYLRDDSLLGYLKGLEKDHAAEFWTDLKIQTGAVWHETIQAQLRVSDIALVLVSQAFLDSDYCRNEEIRALLEQETHLVPIILSACAWEEHDWIAERQYLPTGNKTVEEDFRDPGNRKRFFLKVRTALVEKIEEVRQARRDSEETAPPDPNSPGTYTPRRTSPSRPKLQRPSPDQLAALIDKTLPIARIDDCFERGRRHPALIVWGRSVDWPEAVSHRYSFHRAPQGSYHPPLPLITLAIDWTNSQYTESTSRNSGTS